VTWQRAGVPILPTQPKARTRHWHSDVRALVGDAAFAPDGTLIALPPIETEPFQRRRQRLVFDLLLTQGKIDQDLVARMLDWRHSSFSVHHGVHLDAGDTAD
jgi:hypothetical protein